MNEAIMDYPEAWSWTRGSNLEDHDEQCSWKTHKMMCDCRVLWDEYERRKKQAISRRSMISEVVQSIAKELDGSEYPLRVPENVKRDAKAHGIVIVYGASDDLMEFDGAIYDEVGCYEGGECFVDAKGLIPDYNAIDKDDKDAVRDCLAREGKGRKIESLWCEEPEYSWTYKTDIPHATFEVMEDGKHYCRGIVFRLEDVAE